MSRDDDDSDDDNEEKKQAKKVDKAGTNRKVTYYKNQVTINFVVFKSYMHTHTCTSTFYDVNSSNLLNQYTLLDDCLLLVICVHIRFQLVFERVSLTLVKITCMSLYWRKQEEQMTVIH